VDSGRCSISGCARRHPAVRVADDGGMTIAEHCLELLREKGPMTAADLGNACRWAKLTTARQPDLSVRSALGWAQDGRVLRIGDEFHLVTSLLDRRWLTMRCPEEPRQFDPGIDLACLAGVAQRDGIPLTGGGTLRKLRDSVTWAGPRDWAPSADFVGIRLVDGTAEVAAVELDGDADKRGDALVELLPRAGTGYSFGYGSRHDDLVRDLLTLLHRDPALLRDPVPPLRELVPQPAPPAWQVPPAPAAPPGRSTVAAFVPPWLLDTVEEAAAEAGLPVAVWLGDEIARLVSWPSRPLGPPAWPDDPFPPPRNGRRAGSLYAC
jgi:hypothetical protein